MEKLEHKQLWDPTRTVKSRFEFLAEIAYSHQDVVEFFAVCKALGKDPTALLREMGFLE